MREAPKMGCTSYWFAKNNYTLVEVSWHNDAFDQEAIRQGRAFDTREDGLIALNLACS